MSDSHSADSHSADSHAVDSPAAGAARGDASRAVSSERQPHDPAPALVLGGQNPRHQAWVRTVAAALAAHGRRAEVLDYEFWSAPTRPDGTPIGRGMGVEMDVEAELRRTVDAARNTAGHTGEWTIIAKSIGTVITALGVRRGLLRPRAAVLLGLPLRAIETLSVRDEVWAGLAQLPPAVVVQNEHDPFGGAEEVREVLNARAADQVAAARLCVVAVPGVRTHDYTDTDRYARLLAEVEAEALG